MVLGIARERDFTNLAREVLGHVIRSERIQARTKNTKIITRLHVEQRCETKYNRDNHNESPNLESDVISKQDYSDET